MPRRFARNKRKNRPPRGQGRVKRRPGKTFTRPEARLSTRALRCLFARRLPAGPAGGGDAGTVPSLYNCIETLHIFDYKKGSFQGGAMVFRFFSRLCLAVALLLLPVSGWAASGSTAAPEQANRVPGPLVLPQAWPGGETFPAGFVALMNHFSFSQARLYKGSSRYDYTAPNGAKVGPRRIDQFVNVFKIRYGVTDRFEVRTATPYINAEIKNHIGDGDWKGGLGDTTLMLRYGIKKRTGDSPFSLALDLGATLPTGHVGDQEKYLATNAFSVIMGGGFSWVDHNQRVDFDGRYAAYMEGAHGIKPGDFTLFHGHYAYALTRNFDLGLEGYFRYDQQTEIRGKGQHDAYTEAYAGPKIQIKVPEFAYMMVGAAMLFPVHRDFDGPRFSTDTRYEFSILFAF